MLVVFEGMDGSGKSTLAAGVAGAMELEGNQRFFFPSAHTEPGRLVRRVFTKEVHVERAAMVYLIMADALCLMPHLRDATLRDLVVADRYNLVSGWVYQTSEGWGIHELYDIVRPTLTVQPDLTFIVDVPVHVAMARIDERQKSGGPAKNHLYETDLGTKREKYLAYAQMQPFGEVVVLDGQCPREELVKSAISIIGDRTLKPEIKHRARKYLGE
jgi:dTMP kinase